MITKFRKYTGEKGLGGLFEPFPKSKSADDIPALGCGYGRHPDLGAGSRQSISTS